MPASPPSRRTGSGRRTAITTPPGSAGRAGAGLWLEAFADQQGDRVRWRIAGPDGAVLFEDAKAEPKAQARPSASPASASPPEGWPAGTYTGTVAIERDGRTAPGDDPDRRAALSSLQTRRGSSRCSAAATMRALAASGWTGFRRMFQVSGASAEGTSRRAVRPASPARHRRGGGSPSRRPSSSRAGSLARAARPRGRRAASTFNRR